MSESEQKKVIKEIEMLKQFDHPNVIRLFQVYVDDMKIYMVTELCSGGELFDMIQQQKHFGEKQACMIMDQILQGVSYCHSLGVAHRDLKPENILLENQRSNPHIKIINFGLSRVFTEDLYEDQMAGEEQVSQAQDRSQNINSLQRTMTVVGTSFYMAPEVLQREYDKKCDVWSCAVIMYILLCGRPPFDGATERDILRKVTVG